MKLSRKLARVLALAVLPLALVACDDEEVEEVVEDVARPVKTQVVGQAGGADLRRFPARIESSQRADLSFRVAGKVQEVVVAEGERVESGTVIARLDPTDYQLVVDDRQAKYDQAKAEFDRVEALLNRGFATRQRFEDAKAEFQTAEAALRLAKQDLSYTELNAPFEGEIARRFVENFEDVQAKQPIISMRNTQSLEVKFDVPERIMIQMSEAGDEIVEPDVAASFSAAPDTTFPLAFKEAAAFADPDTQTFEVTYLMQAPSELQVLPGMTATAEVDFSALAEIGTTIFVPVEAVVSANDLSPVVWIVDEEALSVSPRPVEVGEMRGGQIEVTTGLEKGERVVVAGVPFLTEGMAISIMPEIEQAAERQDDAAIRRASEEAAVADAEDDAQDGQADQ